MLVNEQKALEPLPSRTATAARSNLGILAVATIQIILLLSSSNLQAATSFNSQSAVGINLNGVTYYTAEQPFLNLFKTTAITATNPKGWATSSPTQNETNEEPYLQLDADGYPTSLTASSADPNTPQLFTYVQASVVCNLTNSNGGTGPQFRAGQYVVLYDGQGSLRYYGDAQLVSSSPGQDVLNVSNPVGCGINIQITATTPGNYIRNIRIVYAAEQSLLSAGQIFSPAFLQKLQNFRAARFMDWHSTNANPEITWAGRSQVSNAGYGGPGGVPWEIIIALANQAGMDAWVNVPAQADDDYITQMATLFHTSLSASNHLYVEYSNETWNTGFTQNAYVTAQGLAQWPGASGSEANRSFMGMRTAQIADIWKSVWGPDFSRVTVVLGAQAANPWTATESLKSPLWTGTGNGPASAHPIGAVAIAPYFGENNSPLSWLTMSQSAALTLVFNQITNGGAAPNGYPGGSLKQASDWEAAYAPALAPYQLPLLAYEAGQTLTSINTWINDGSTGPSDAFQALYTTANRDSRMGSAYTTYLNQWKANGGQLFMHFVDASSPAIWGEWGALESFLDTTSPLSSSPPKWNALQSFIANNPCWWPNCAGTVGSSSAPSAPTPNPPTNLTVQ